VRSKEVSGLALEKADNATLCVALGAWGVSAYLIACETELVPQHLSVYGRVPENWLHWQAWLLAGILFFAIRDVFMDLRCVTCGTRENLLLGRWLLARRLLCSACREQEAAAQTQAAAEPDEAVPAEYAELFEALK
jgi:hypothetical protein